MAGTTRYGPLVHRAVHHAAIFLLAGVVIFLAGNALTQWAWDYFRNSSTPVYSLQFNYISDLGAIHCHEVANRYVCSPWHFVFATATVLLGLCLIFGVLLMKSAFPPRRVRTIGLGILALSGVGAIGVGLFAEDYDLTVHTASALLAFLGSNLALLVLSVAMLRDTRWDGYRLFTAACGLFGLVALILFVAHAWGPVGVGGMERLIVAPTLVWAAVVGVHLYRIPTFSAPKVEATGSP